MPDHDEKAGKPVDLILQVSTCWSEGKHLLEYNLRSPSGAVHLPRERFRSKAIGQPDEFRRDLLAELENLRQGLDVEDTALVSPEALATLTSLGQWLYQRLFPEPMREAYRLFRDQVTTFLIISDEPWIPWEIVRPFEDQISPAPSLPGCGKSVLSSFSIHVKLGGWGRHSRGSVGGRRAGWRTAARAPSWRLFSPSTTPPPASSPKSSIASSRRGAPWAMPCELPTES